MANTYTQIHLQLIFGVKYREALIDPNWETELHKYISEIIMKYKFNWQSGYGAFSYSKSDLMNVIKYIQNQKEHHKKISFVEEYQKFLQLFEVDFDKRYIFRQPISIFDDKLSRR